MAQTCIGMSNDINSLPKSVGHCNVWTIGVESSRERGQSKMMYSVSQSLCICKAWPTAVQVTQLPQCHMYHVCYSLVWSWGVSGILRSRTRGEPLLLSISSNTIQGCRELWVPASWRTKWTPQSCRLLSSLLKQFQVSVLASRQPNATWPSSSWSKRPVGHLLPIFLMRMFL